MSQIQRLESQLWNIASHTATKRKNKHSSKFD